MITMYFDSGTTNSRAFLLKGNEVIRQKSKQVGSRDSTIRNDNSFLISELKGLYDDLLIEANLKDKDIVHIYMSGMISSPAGMVEVEHLSTPVGLNELKENIYSHYEADYFKRNINIIPGIKTIPSNLEITTDNVEIVNNMRGEETEIIGVLSDKTYTLPPNGILIIPGSHTQLAFIEDKQIVNILSTITGELYASIASQTILNSSITGDAKGNYIDPSMVCKGYSDLLKHGFNRALYIVRTMELFTNNSLSERQSYFQGVLNGGVITAMLNSVDQNHYKPEYMGIVGNTRDYHVYLSIMNEFYPHFKVHHIENNPKLPFSVKGYSSISLAD